MIQLVVDGMKWFYNHDRICDVLEVSLKTRAFHLWDAQGEYLGHFRTKREMMEFIKCRA